jgi:hypothetical protein
VRGRIRTGAIACGLLLSVLCAGARAEEINVPLHIDNLALNAALTQKLYTAPGGRAQFFQGTDECQYFYVERPRFGRRDAQVTLETDGNLRLGLALGGGCVGPISWSGIIEAETAPYIAGLALKFRVTDINFYNPDRSKSEIAGRAFDLVKGNLIPHLETFSYDLAPAMRQLNSLAASITPSPTGDQARAALASIRLGPAVVAEDDGVRLTLQIALPDALAGPAVGSPPTPLTAAETAAWRGALGNVDAFLATAAGQIHAMVPDNQMGNQLIAIVQDGRRRFDEAVAHPPANPDPFPIFRDDWERLRMVIKEAAYRGLAGGQTLELLGLVSLGDALFAIDAEAPALGSRLATAGLHELSQRPGESGTAAASRF